MNNYLPSRILFISICGLFIASALSGSAAPWIMFHHDQQHTGYTTDLGPDMNQVFWDTTTDTSISGISYSSPCFSKGRMYIGCLDGALLCLDALPDEQNYSDGDPDESPINDPADAPYDFIWRFNTGDMITSSPLYYDGKIYFGSHDGSVYCIYSCIGEEIETYPTASPISSSPILVDDYLYIGSDDGNLYCFHATPLVHTWEFETLGSIQGSPAADNGFVVVGSTDGNLYCVYANNGTSYWTTSLGSPLIASPTIANNNVFIGTQSGMFSSFYLTNGSLHWELSVGDTIRTTPAVYENYVVFGADNGHVYCVNAQNGSLIWEKTTTGSIQSSPIIADELVYVGSTDHTMYCYHLLDGSVQWSAELDDAITSSPAVLSGHLYVATESGTIYCFRNHNPPLQPSRPDGPEFGIIDYEYTFIVETTDPEKDFIYYQLEWGDGKTTDWLGPYTSGEAIEQTHTYSQEGNHSVRVRSKDRYGYESEWSEPLYIDINILDVTGIRGGLGLHATIENKGSRKVWKIQWSIQYEGGRVLNPANDEFSDEILNLAAGDSIDITTGPFFEIGRIRFIIDLLDKDGDNAYSTTLKAFSLGFLVILLPW